jgi:hypothetical protein
MLYSVWLADRRRTQLQILHDDVLCLYIPLYWKNIFHLIYTYIAFVITVQILFDISLHEMLKITLCAHEYQFTLC